MLKVRIRLNHNFKSALLLQCETYSTSITSSAAAWVNIGPNPAVLSHSFHKLSFLQSMEFCLIEDWGRIGFGQSHFLWVISLWPKVKLNPIFGMQKAQGWILSPLLTQVTPFSAGSHNGLSGTTCGVRCHSAWGRVAESDLKYTVSALQYHVEWLAVPLFSLSLSFF